MSRSRATTSAAISPTDAPSAPSAVRSGSGRPADRQGRADYRGSDRGQRPVAVRRARVVVPDAAADWRLDFLYAADAGWRRACDGFRQEPRAAADREGRPHHVRGCRRHRRGEAGTRGNRRVPEGPEEVSAARRQDPERRAAGRPSGYRQDAAGARDRRRGRRSVLHHLRLGLRRDVCRRRRQPGARHVRAGQEERAVHHLHRRNRRGRPSPRRRPRRRQRRARADLEPAARRDGRVRRERGCHPDRRDEPPGRARPGAAAPRPVRSTGRRAEPRRRRPREDPEGPHAQGAALRGCRSRR